MRSPAGSLPAADDTKKKKGYAGSDILMTQELLPLDSWDTDAVGERQRELSKWVFEIWHFHGEAAPVEPGGAPSEAPAAAAGPRDDAADLEQLPEVPE